MTDMTLLELAPGTNNYLVDLPKALSLDLGYMEAVW